jgi:hypothetical protein
MSVAHDALVTSECLLHGLGGRSELREERQEVPLWRVRRSALCISCFEFLQKHEEPECEAVAAGVVY